MQYIIKCQHCVFRLVIIMERCVPGWWQTPKTNTTLTQRHMSQRRSYIVRTNAITDNSIWRMVWYFNSKWKLGVNNWRYACLISLHGAIGNVRITKQAIWLIYSIHIWIIKWHPRKSSMSEKRKKRMKHWSENKHSLLVCWECSVHMLST